MQRETQYGGEPDKGDSSPADPTLTCDPACARVCTHTAPLYCACSYVAECVPELRTRGVRIYMRSFSGSDDLAAPAENVIVWPVVRVRT